MSDSSILDNLVVRPVRKEEVSRWNSYMQQYHYLGLRWIGGKSLRYIAHIEGQWVALLGWSSASKNCGIAIDGKTVRGSHNGARKAIHLLSAVIHKEGVVFAQEQVDEKTNEIKHVKPLFKKINIEGSVVTADALHTQTDIALYLVEEKKADYLFTAKDNQPTLLEDIKALELKKTQNPNPNQTISLSTKGTDV